MSEKNQGGKQGFAAMDKDRHRQISAKGGRTKTDKPKGFAARPDVASKAGQKSSKKKSINLEEGESNG